MTWSRSSFASISLTEYKLERIIESTLARGERFLDKTKLNYSQKLELVYAFDSLPSRVVGSLRKLNALRNAFSHRRNFEFGTEELDRVGRPLGSEFSKIKREHPELKKRIIMTFLSLDKELHRDVLHAEHSDVVPKRGDRVSPGV